MSEPTARTYMDDALQAMSEAKGLSPATRALIYASLAQAEATLEVAGLLRSGISLGYAEELTNALNRLARRMPDR